MAGYSKGDAGRDTGASTGKVSEAWHQARDDAAKEGGWGVPKDRHNTGGGGGGCFIATAAFGDPLAAELDALRRFREETLRPYRIGRRIIRIYELISPPIADALRRNDGARAAVRWLIRAGLGLVRRKGAR